MDGFTESQQIFANYLTLIDKYGLKHKKVQQYGNENPILKDWVDIINKLQKKRPTLLENIIFEVTVFCSFIGFCVVILAFYVCIGNWIK